MSKTTPIPPDAPGAQEDCLCALALIDAAGREDPQAIAALLGDDDRNWPRVIGALTTYSAHLAAMTGDAGAAIGLLRRAVLEAWDQR